MNQATVTLLQNYYDAFNRQDMAAFLDMLTDDVIHDVNQSGREVGKEKFSAFMDRFL